MRLCKPQFLAPEALQAVYNNRKSGGIEKEIKKQPSNHRAKYVLRL